MNLEIIPWKEWEKKIPGKFGQPIPHNIFSKRNHLKKQQTDFLMYKRLATTQDIKSSLEQKPLAYVTCIFNDQHDLLKFQICNKAGSRYPRWLTHLDTTMMVGTFGNFILCLELLCILCHRYKVIALLFWIFSSYLGYLCQWCFHFHLCCIKAC